MSARTNASATYSPLPGVASVPSALATHERGDGNRPDRHRPAAAEEGVEKGRRDAGVEPDFRRQPGEQCVGHRLRHQHDRRDCAGEQVAGEVLALIGRQPDERRNEPADQVLHRFCRSGPPNASILGGGRAEVRAGADLANANNA